MERPDTGLTIHSISLGVNPNDSMKWTVGQEVNGKRGSNKKYKITAIFQDDSHWELFGVISFVIYVTEDGTTNHLWRRYTNIPHNIVYDL